MTRRAGAQIALRFLRMQIRSTWATKAADPALRMKAARRRRSKGAWRRSAGQRRVTDDAQAFVTTDAEGLSAMTAATVRLIASRVESMSMHIITAVNVERLDDAVVAALAIGLRVTAGAVIGIV